MKRLLLCCGLYFAFAVHAFPATAPVALSVTLADASILPGGTAQLQIFLASPRALVSGGAVIDLDPAIFGDITAADAYSADGDQVGRANIEGRHLEIDFSSHTGGIGRLPNLPVFSINVPVLPTAGAEAKFALTLKPSFTPWVDTEGVTYSASVVAGTFTVGGGLSVKNVGILGGLLPAGTAVQIDGTGFSNATSVQIDGVAIASTQFVSPEQMNVILGAAADLTFHRVTVQNPGGIPAIFFPVLHGQPLSGLSTVQPIFPNQLYPAGTTGNFAFAPGFFALQNPTSVPVDVAVRSEAFYSNGPRVSQTLVTIPPGGSYLQPGDGNIRDQMYVIPRAPIQMVVAGESRFAAVEPVPVPFTGVGISAYGPVTWNWTLGSKAPAPQRISVYDNGLATPFVVTATTESGGDWLSVSPMQGTACKGGPLVTCPPSGLVTVTADPTLLAAGTYRGTLTFMPQGFNPAPTILPVIFNALSQRILYGNEMRVDLATTLTAPAISRLPITSSADATPFTTSVTATSGRNWLSVTPTQGQAPGTLTITADPVALGGQPDTGTITVTGPDNSLVIPVSFYTYIPLPVTPGVSPQSLKFSAQHGQPPPATRSINIYSYGPFNLSTHTVNGGNWLSAVLRGDEQYAIADVSTDPTGLAVGTYEGSITVTGKTAEAPAQVPVTLYVWNAPPPVSANPAVLSFAGISGGGSPSQKVIVSTGILPLSFSVSTSTSDGGTWLYASPSISFPPDQTPVTVTVNANASSLKPGSYTGVVAIAAPAGSTNTTAIPVTFTVSAAPVLPLLPLLPLTGAVPTVTAVLNAASQNLTTVSPGEIVTIFGQNIGPATPAGFALGPDGKIATELGGAQVLFDGVPAPMIYAFATQVNAIVPYSVSGESATNIAVQYNGTNIPAGGYPVASSTPGIFTLAGNGQGAAPVLNQDNSINGASNPAARGSSIQIFATGEGVTLPSGVTGEVTGADVKKPVLPVSVAIGGVDARVSYAGSAPDAVSGLFQLNVVIPQGVPPGSAVPITVTVGTAVSQAKVTIALK